MTRAVIWKNEPTTILQDKRYHDWFWRTIEGVVFLAKNLVRGSVILQLALYVQRIGIDIIPHIELSLFRAGAEFMNTHPPQRTNRLLSSRM